jgi:Na+/H+ antiporter NhaC
MEVGELEIDDKTRFRFNIATIMISAFIFLAILAWFDFMQTAFYVWLSPEVTDQLVAPSVKLWYAILITFMVIILVYLIHYYTRRTI